MRRREFLEQTAAAGAVWALSPAARVLGANDRIRLGIIGPGARGQELLGLALALSPRHEFAQAFDDLAGPQHLIGGMVDHPAAIREEIDVLDRDPGGQWHGDPYRLALRLDHALAPQGLGQRGTPAVELAGTRVATMPQVPTLQEAGIADYEANSWQCMVAPARLAEPIVTRLNKALVEVLATRETQVHFMKLGVQPLATTPAETSAYIRREIARWAKVVRSLGTIEE